MNITFFPMHFVGLLGMPRRVYTYAPNMGFDAMNMMSTVGALLLVPSLLTFVWNAIWSLKHGKPSGDDPWGGATLEWAISSPPPSYNFGSLPEVHSLDPLWHKDGRVAALASNQVRGHIHMPPPSIWPLVSGLGVTLLMSGMIFGWYVGIPGLVLMLVGLYSWAFEPCA
jgi:heme/copper-type cytochrome/quinol oxidase subunit 1